mgnify:CR=1 FL=1
MAISAMVHAFDLTKLDRVDQQAHVAMFSEPYAVMLVVNFVPVTDTILDDTPMATQVQNRWRRFSRLRARGAPLGGPRRNGLLA